MPPNGRYKMSRKWRVSATTCFFLRGARQLRLIDPQVEKRKDAATNQWCVGVFKGIQQVSVEGDYVDQHLSRSMSLNPDDDISAIMEGGKDTMAAARSLMDARAARGASALPLCGEQVVIPDHLVQQPLVLTQAPSHNTNSNAIFLLLFLSLRGRGCGFGC